MKTNNDYIKQLKSDIASVNKAIHNNRKLGHLPSTNELKFKSVLETELKSLTKKNVKKVTWSDGTNVFVIRKGKTTNDKISDGSELVQTYTFSVQQWLLASTSKGFGMKKFFSLDGSNCLDCPFSGNQGKGGCYTHKFQQYVGFISMLRSIKHSDLTPLDDAKREQVVSMCDGSYVRFGTYGEPSLLPIDLVSSMSDVAKSWTGYTHQWQKDWAQPFRDYFMASRHESTSAEGWRSFQALSVAKIRESFAVGCPASKEGGYKSNCATCGLCSGLLGKGRKDVKIIVH